MSKRETRVEAEDKKAGMTYYELTIALGRVLVNGHGETISPVTLKAEVGFGQQIKALIIQEEV